MKNKERKPIYINKLPKVNLRNERIVSALTAY